MFRMNEGELALPAGWKDRTINVFIVGETPPLDLTVVISRDQLAPDQDLLAYAEEQLLAMPSQLKSFRLIGKRQRTVAGQSALEIEITFKSENGPIHQRQVFSQRDRRVLAFALTAPVKIADDHETQFEEMLASFSPWDD